MLSRYVGRKDRRVLHFSATTFAFAWVLSASSAQSLSTSPLNFLFGDASLIGCAFPSHVFNDSRSRHGHDEDDAGVVAGFVGITEKCRRLGFGEIHFSGNAVL